METALPATALLGEAPGADDSLVLSAPGQQHKLHVPLAPRPDQPLR